MALVITVAQRKGGAGKTLLAANLAVAMAPGRRVALLDIDPQKSLTRWHAIRSAAVGRDEVLGRAAALTFSDISGWRLGNELDRLRVSHDVVFVDSPPQVDTDAKLAVRGADLVLVPLQPSPPDLWAAEGTLALAAAERRQARLVFNRVPATATLRREVDAEIARRGLPLLTASLGNRLPFATAFARGLGVTEAAPRSVAADEIRALLAEIEETLR